MSTRRPPVFLGYGFRPFFLLAGIHAVVAMAAWAAWIGLHAANYRVLTPGFDFIPFLWHAHEMLFGYTAAVIAGFLLTAVANWTGRPPVSGAPLAFLALLWLAGRVAVWFSASLPPAIVMAVDAAFLPLVIALAASHVIAARNWRNLAPLAVIAVIAAANGLAHLSRMEITAVWPMAAYGLALDSIVLLIAIIGGRIIPAFTRNAFQRDGIEPLPRSYRPLDAAAIGLVAALLFAEGFGLGDRVAGTLALLAGLANFLRLAGWRGLRTLYSPILWVLHMGYFWLAAGLVARGLAHFDIAIVRSTADHLLTVGAIGSMTLAMITRAALGHTGRALSAGRPIALAYAFVSLAALARILTPLLAPGHYNAGILLAAGFWIAAFSIYVIVYAPILTAPAREPDGPT